MRAKIPPFPETSGHKRNISIFLNAIRPPHATYLVANQAHAQFSTAPKTAEGKKRSLLNAFCHGLNSQAVLLPCEDAIAFGFAEEQSTQSLSDLAWHALSDKAEASGPEVQTALTMAPRLRSGRVADGRQHP